jgi:hypothetical protein
VDPIRGNGRKVHDGVRTVQTLDGLSEVGQICEQELRRGFRRPHDVDSQNLMVVLEQVDHDSPPRLPAGAGDDDVHELETSVFVNRMGVPGATVEATEHGRVCKSDSWFVVKSREIRCFESEGWGRRVGIEGESEYTVNETAIRYGAGIERGTPQDDAYARFPPRYGGWLDDIF